MLENALLNFQKLSHHIQASYKKVEEKKVQTCTKLEWWKINFLWLKEWPFVGVFCAKRTK